MGFPLIRLASLFVRRLNAPIANKIKKTAKESTTFQKFCWRAAESYQKRDSNVKTKLRKLGVEAEPTKPMSRESAVNLGAEVIEEMSTYAFIIALMALEFKYSAKRKAKKDEDAQCRLKEAERKIAMLETQTDFLNAILKEQSKARLSQ